ncbi:MAG TPA: hypothetical protein VJ583_04185 [Nitrososphaeraceae archaeon]|nr:hypothetical protein [Nitrososphaeraceae archaeon]
MKIVVILTFIVVMGILFGLTQQVFAQFSSSSPAEQMMSHMRFTHSQLANNIEQVMELVKSNNTSEAITLLEGMEIRINHMNTMFNDLVWELSNKGH